jgi:hypothetical protein
MSEVIMPKRIEQALKREAKKHSLKPGTRQYGAYVYGTLARLKKRGKKHHAH